MNKFKEYFLLFRARQTVGFNEGKIQQHANVLTEFRSVRFDHFGNWIREAERKRGWEDDTTRDK